MSLIFLDPNSYSYTEDEWRGGDAFDRLRRLVELLTEIDGSEERIEDVNSVLFVIPDSLLAISLESNPTINTPPNPFYHRLYVTKILPSLTRRRDTVVYEEHRDDSISERADLDDCVVSEALYDFLCCVSATQAKTMTYTYHSQRVSLTIGSDIFFDEVSFCNIHGRYFVNYRSIFPCEKKRHLETALLESVNILWERLKRSDSTWSTHKPSNIYVHDDFTSSLAKSDFRDLDYEYQERIVYSLLQITAARSISINEHSMKTHKIRFDNKWYGKWNSYVFQSGPNDRDTRCSRLYYAKISSGILLHSYEEDAHP